MTSNTTDINRLVEVLVFNLSSKKAEIKKLKEQISLLEQKLKEHNTKLEHSSVTGTDISDQCVPTYRPTHTLTEDNKCLCSLKQSNHDVFNFPEPSRMRSGCGRPDCKNIKSVNNEEDIEAVWNLIDNSKGPALIPEKDFKSVICELIKTKTLLKNLQKSQADVNNIKLEDKLQRAELKNEYMERHIKKMETERLHHQQQMAKLKLGQIELNITEESSSQMPSSSMLTKLKAEIEELRLKNQALVEAKNNTEIEKQNLLRESKKLQMEISRCRENEHFLGTSLKEVKDRCMKTSATLASLRQQYEELNVEKNALEKELDLERQPGKRYSHSSGNRANAAESPPRHPSTTKGYNIMPDLRFANSLDQNNLSPSITERKPSNLSQSSNPYTCSRCLAEFFDDEDTYMHHLHKCINCV
ncbi:hypothetical protein ACF0H5_000881 [Mactra antiquata]